MKKAIVIILFIISCGKSTYNYAKIDIKYEKDGKYFFALILDDATGSSDVDSGRVYGDVSVDKTVYLLKQIGDDYCIEE